jgi:hypothetical protein
MIEIDDVSHVAQKYDSLQKSRAKPFARLATGNNWKPGHLEIAT